MRRSFALLLVVVLSTAALPSCRMVGSNTSTSESLRLREEFNSISSPPWATKVEDTRIIKTSGGLIGARYSTDRSFGEITNYYDRQLLAKGYKRLEVKSI